MYMWLRAYNRENYLLRSTLEMLKEGQSDCRVRVGPDQARKVGRGQTI